MVLLQGDRPSLPLWQFPLCGPGGTIMITQGADSVAGHLNRHVHAPVRWTLKVGFAADFRRHRCKIIELLADQGWHKPPNNKSERLHRGWAALQSGDLVIHIGSHRDGSAGDFLDRAIEMKARGIRCVLYQMEPFAQRFARGNTSGLFEIWDYAWANVNSWRSGFRERRLTPCRYVPPGFLSQLRRRVEAAPELDLLGHRPQLAFLGEERPCFADLPGVSSPRLRLIQGVYNSTQYVSLRRSEPNLVMLNCHRINPLHSCTDRDAPLQVLEAVRLSLLLSLNYLVVSQVALKADMREFSGLVLFEPTMFPGASGEWSADTRSLLANQTLLTAFARRAFVTFRERFEPRRVLEKAGVLLPHNNALRAGTGTGR